MRNSDNIPSSEQGEYSPSELAKILYLVQAIFIIVFLVNNFDI